MDNDALRAKIAREEEELKDAIQAGLLKKFSPEWKTAQDNINADKQLLIQLQGENLASRSPPSFLVAPCMPANPRGGPLTNFWELPKGRPADRVDSVSCSENA